jgi:hypothetical protein
VTVQEYNRARIAEFKDWIRQAMAYSHAQTDALRRGAAANAMTREPTVDLAQFSRPFPGSPQTTTVTDNSINGVPNSANGSPATPPAGPVPNPPATPPAGNPAVPPAGGNPVVSPPVAAAAPDKVGHALAWMALAACMLLAGTGIGAVVVGSLRGKPAAVQPEPPVPPPGPGLSDRDWQIRIVP